MPSTQKMENILAADTSFCLLLNLPTLLKETRARGPYQTEAEVRAEVLLQSEEINKSPFKLYATFTLQELRFFTDGRQPEVIREEIILSKWLGQDKINREDIIVKET